MGIAPSLAHAWRSRASDGATVGETYKFGMSYYPEQWPAAQVPEDFAKMQSLGVNLVRMGEFAWSSMQPAPNVFRWDWLDRTVDLASRHGIGVVLGTPIAMMPPWLMKLHPDVLGGNEAGLYTYGGRKGFSLDSPAMKAAATEIISRLTTRYGSNPAVVGWQLSNEPGYPTQNFDHNALLGFRTWLKARYATLEKLNAAWSGAFWSNTYDAWDEIVFPTNSAEGGWNPGIKLDYARFFSDSFLRWLRFEAALVRQHARNQFVYTNWPEVAWSVDIFKSAEFLDAAAWDNYGVMPGTADCHEVLHTAFNHDLCRASQKTQRFFVAEQPTQPSADTDARSIRLTTWADVAYGSSGTVFFEWRAPLEGSEMGYVSMLEPDGSFGISAPLLQKTMEEIGRLYPRLREARTVADHALIYSYENSWDQGYRLRSGPNVGMGYDNTATRYYTGLKSLKRNVDVIPETRDLAPYKLVVAPGLRIVSDEHASRIAQWVQSGGILVIDHKAGTREADGRLRPLLEPGVFAEVAGLHVAGTERTHGSPHTVSVGDSPQKFSVTQSEVLAAGGTDAVAWYHGENLEGKPAVTVHPAGRGFVVYLSFACADDAFFDALFAALGRRFDIAPLIAAPAAVDVVSRVRGAIEYVFLINNTRQPIGMPLSGSPRELLSGTTPAGHLTLGALQVAILERPIAG